MGAKTKLCNSATLAWAQSPSRNPEHAQKAPWRLIADLSIKAMTGLKGVENDRVSDWWEDAEVSLVFFLRASNPVPSVTSAVICILSYIGLRHRLPAGLHCEVQSHAFLPRPPRRAPLWRHTSGGDGPRRTQAEHHAQEVKSAAKTWAREHDRGSPVLAGL